MKNEVINGGVPFCVIVMHTGTRLMNAQHFKTLLSTQSQRIRLTLMKSSFFCMNLQIVFNFLKHSV